MYNSKNKLETAIQQILSNIGKKTVRFFAEIGGIFILLMKIFKQTPQIFRTKKQLIIQMDHIGVGSIPLVFVIALFTGAVAAWQAAYQLKGLAPLSFLGTATSRAIITELGPVLTAIVIAGRIGASIAAEIGSMKVTDQINALLTMAIDPVRYLALPRFYASIIMIPILVIFADIIAIFGAYFISNYFLSVSADVFFDSVKKTFLMQDLFFGIIKGFFFGGITALVGTFLGFQTSGGAEGVGKSTIKAFVLISATILIFDYIFWMFIN